MVSENGKLTGGIVCARCASDGICIVLKRPVKKEVKREVRHPQLEAIKRELQKFATFAVMQGAKDETIEAYDKALALVEAAQEGRPL